MSSDFMNDAEYIEACGSRTVLELASTLISIFDRHEFGSYEGKTVGRISDLAAIKKEISCMQSDLRDSKKLFGYFRKTVMYLQERESTAQKHMEWLKMQEKEQERLRAKYARGTIPSEIMNRMLSYIPTDNKLNWAGKPTVFVYGLLPLAIYNPSLLLPYYERSFSAEWSLKSISEQKLKWSVLVDVSLTNRIELHAETWGDGDVSTLQPLMKYPLRWKGLAIHVNRLKVDDFIDVIKPCLPRLEELRVNANIYISGTSSPIVLPPDSCPRLKTATLYPFILPDFFKSGVLNSITSLTLKDIDPRRFPSHDAFTNMLNDLPLVLSRLSRLREFVVRDIHCGRDDLEGLRRVQSASLCSLDIRGFHDDVDIAFLNLFIGCTVDCINVHANILEEAERLFGEARRVGFLEYVPDILFQRKQDGSLAFPKLEHMELNNIWNPTEDETLQIQNHLLEAVRTRYEDPSVLRVGHLRIPTRVVTNGQFQDELERYVPSLVLF